MLLEIRLNIALQIWDHSIQGPTPLIYCKDLSIFTRLLASFSLSEYSSRFRIRYYHSHRVILGKQNPRKGTCHGNLFPAGSPINPIFSHSGSLSYGKKISGKLSHTPQLSTPPTSSEGKARGPRWRQCWTILLNQGRDI